MKNSHLHLLATQILDSRARNVSWGAAIYKWIGKKTALGKISPLFEHLKCFYHSFHILKNVSSRDEVYL